MQKEQEIFNHVLNHLGNVKYDDEDEKIKNDFSAFFTLVPKILNMHYTSDIPEYGDLFQPLAMASTLVKHHGFREEREVRIVVASMSQYSKSIFCADENNLHKAKAIRYRKKGDGEARYIVLFGENKENALPIKRVIIGPSRIQNLNYQLISDLLQGTRIEVSKSETPFLG